jgi:hypothetical protein
VKDADALSKPASAPKLSSFVPNEAAHSSRGVVAIPIPQFNATFSLRYCKLSCQTAIFTKQQILDTPYYEIAVLKKVRHIKTMHLLLPINEGLHFGSSSQNFVSTQNVSL